MTKCSLIVTTTFGLEKIVKNELQDLGFDGFKTLDGKIEFEATLEDIPRLNISLRAADRVLLKLAEFKAVDFDALFEGVSTVDWEKWIPKEAMITVTSSVTRSKIDSTRVCQSMVKKAIVENLKKEYDVDWMSESGAEFTIKAAILKDVVLLTLDATGVGLHKRGYRQEAGEAPMRENLAAALVLLSFWTKDRVLVDPMCGSGTILIEAAMLARNMAPGLNRSFAAEDWPYISKECWEEARVKAREQVDKNATLQIFGFDSDTKRVEDSKINANNAGVLDDIIFEQGDAKQLELKHDYGIVISNPPYGINIGSDYAIDLLYKSLNNIFKERPDWSLYLITADKQFPEFFTRAKPDRVRKLYNGNIEAHYFQYYGSRPPRN
ncbi:MAG: putative N6-adenine-specific DNA methylase [Lysobacterales bacterium]|jgi:putative N6-adenine-specific DNA methylase